MLGSRIFLCGAAVCIDLALGVLCLKLPRFRLAIWISGTILLGVATIGLDKLTMPAAATVNPAAHDGISKSDLEDLYKKLQGSSQQQPLPGFSTHLLVKINKLQLPGKHFILEYGPPDKNNFCLYLNSDNDTMVLSVADKTGQEFSTIAQFGGSGIPADEPVYLSATLATGESSSTLTIGVNNRDISHLTTDVPIDVYGLGYLGGTVGADANHNNSRIAMTLYTLLVYGRALTEKEQSIISNKFSSILVERGISNGLPNGQ